LYIVYNILKLLPVFRKGLTCGSFYWCRGSDFNFVIWPGRFFFDKNCLWEVFWFL